jgi:hypothetical protein
MYNSQEINLRQWLRSTPGLAFLALLAFAVVFLLTEHTAHILERLPYALLLLCPLLHLFMHSGHGDHSGHPQPSRPSGKADPHNLHSHGGE